MMRILLVTLLLASGTAHAADLVVGFSAAITSIDPHFHTLASNNATNRHVFDRLVPGRWNGRSGFAWITRFAASQPWSKRCRSRSRPRGSHAEKRRSGSAAGAVCRAGCRPTCAPWSRPPMPQPAWARATAAATPYPPSLRCWRRRLRHANGLIGDTRFETGSIRKLSNSALIGRGLAVSGDPRGRAVAQAQDEVQRMAVSRAHRG
jgi:hypothetical protein